MFSRAPTAKWLIRILVEATHGWSLHVNSHFANWKPWHIEFKVLPTKVVMCVLMFFYRYAILLDAIWGYMFFFTSNHVRSLTSNHSRTTDKQICNVNGVKYCHQPIQGYTACYYMEFNQKNQTKNITNIWVCKHPQPFSRGGGPLYVTYIFSIFQVSKMWYYIFDIGPKNVSLTFLAVPKEIVILHFLYVTFKM